MSARRPDAWRISHDGGQERVISYEPHCPLCVVAPLYALSESDLETIWQAAALIENMSGITARDEALAAALRSIVEGKAG